MLDLDKLLDDAVARRMEQPRSETVRVFLGDEAVSLKFTELDGDTWATCTMAHLPRKHVLLDQTFSYNISAASKSAAPLSGVLVDGDVETKLSDEQWAKLFRAADPQGRQVITDAVFAVNEYAQLGRIDAARKDFEAVWKRKPRSPAS